MKQLALDVAEVHDVYQERQQRWNQVPAERHVARSASTTDQQPRSPSRQS